MRVVEANSVSRARTRDRGVAYWVKSTGGARRERSTTRSWAGAGVSTPAAVPATASTATARTAPRRAPRLRPASEPARTSATRERRPRWEASAHSSSTPQVRPAPIARGARAAGAPQARATSA